MDIGELISNVPGLKGLLIKTAMRIMSKPKKKNSIKFKEKLEAEGHQVSIIDHKNFLVAMKDTFMPVKEFQKRYDLIVYYLNICSLSNQTSMSIPFASILGSDSPWFVHEIPTVLVSFGSPYHDLDAPMVPTFINAYMANDFSIDSVISKLQGKSKFKGVSPVKLDLKEFDGTI